MYSALATQILDDYTRIMAPTEYVVYLKLVHLSTKRRNPEITVSNSTLANLCNQSEPTVRKALKNLRQKGFVRLILGHHKQTASTYWIARNPLDPASNNSAWDPCAAFSKVTAAFRKPTTREELELALKDFFFDQWKKQLNAEVTGRIYALARHNGGLNEAMFLTYFDTFVWKEMIANRSDRELQTLYEVNASINR